ncbi:MAG: trypsin-like serine protease [Gammaproteobacteria bacterium]|nr:trypsin-like serine protease [Gammaproteobacteria bacterium]
MSRRARFSLLLLPLFIISFSAASVVIRHDADDARYRADAAEFPALVDLPHEGHGVLVAPQWVLTAAHAVSWQQSVDSVVINGESREVEALIRHSGYQSLPPEVIKEAETLDDPAGIFELLRASDDIALLKLAAPVDDVRPAVLYRGAIEAGQRVKIIGKGATGNGLRGHEPQGPNRTELRRAFNEISGIEDRWLTYTFDAPPEGLPLEGMAGNGDSGSPLLVEVDGEWQVAGLTSWKFADVALSEFRPAMYGQLSYNVRIEHYRDWIETRVGSLN